MESIENMLFNEFTEEAERSIGYGDALDVKASIWLVIITFLATQTAYFLGQNLPSWEHYGQVLAALLLIIAGVLTLVELCPRTYSIFSPSNGAIEERVAELHSHYANFGNIEESVSAQILKDQMEWAKERTIKNQRLNAMKSRLVDWSFRFMAAGVAINLLTLLHFIKASAS